LTTLKEKLEPQEAKVIALKYSGKTFGDMNEDEIWFAAKTILLKIHTITGWTIPVSELMDILIDQFRHKLQEGYAKVTVGEVEYAFRNKGLDIQDWGKALSLTMIDEVMLPYLNMRYRISQMEESIRTRNLLESEEKKELSDGEWEEWIADMRQYDLKLLPCSAYDYLDKKGRINLTVQEKRDYMDRAIAHLLGTLEPMSKEMIDFAAMKKVGVFSAEVTATLKTISKRFAVQDYLKNN
jgi:hypothetical protein